MRKNYAGAAFVNLLLAVAVLAGFALAARQAAAASPQCASGAQYVIEVSVDGLGSRYLQHLIAAGEVPNLHRLQAQGASTLNARADYDLTATLPNHVTMVTARGVHDVCGRGHDWTSNTDPAPGQTLQGNKGCYVASVFDAAHDHGLRTAMYAGKSKFSLFDVSYDAAHGAPDRTGPDHGRDKLDVHLIADSATITDDFLIAMRSRPFQYALLHYGDPDAAGHALGWGSPGYYDAVKNVDGCVGRILDLVDADPALRGSTVIIVTADHGGRDHNHALASDPLNYTIPFIVWGTGVAAGADLYVLNGCSRQDPGCGRPSYSACAQPLRNGDGANLALALLGLGPIPGSTINARQDLNVAPCMRPHPHRMPCHRLWNPPLLGNQGRALTIRSSACYKPDWSEGIWAARGNRVCGGGGVQFLVRGDWSGSQPLRHVPPKTLRP